ncbi:MAG TPA: SRPBCC domain-containing protein [Actinomycetota bacterium]|nr:SRPBCC domain-containing protein [Actinomycetota bacterium]
MVVRLAPRPAFDLFTVGMDRWWPLDSYSRAVSELAPEKVEAVRLDLQPGLGGSIIEHLDDGRTLPWGVIAEWRPPDRVVIEWKPHSLPEPPTEVDVTFTGHDRGTLVEVEHRGWDRLSEGFCDALRPVYERGWPPTLARYVAAAGQDAAPES